MPVYQDSSSLETPPVPVRAMDIGQDLHLYARVSKIFPHSKWSSSQKCSQIKENHELIKENLRERPLVINDPWRKGTLSFKDPLIKRHLSIENACSSPKVQCNILCFVFNLQTKDNFRGPREVLLYVT